MKELEAGVFRNKVSGLAGMSGPRFLRVNTVNELENKMACFIKENGLFGSAGRIILAISGGADSTALLHAMHALKAEKVLEAQFIVAHINHQLRGADAEADEDFVIAEAGKLNLDTITRRVDVLGFARTNRLSIETAARKLRIESLLDIAKSKGCNVIATAHQKNDNAETVIHRMLRGTGFRGLGGIWPARNFTGDKRFARPLLCISRDEIISYLEKRNLRWRTDRTNKDCTYRRNFIRHRLIPALQQQCKDSLIEQLFVLSRSAQRLYSMVCRCAEEAWPKLADCGADTVALNLKGFLTQAESVKVELVRRSLAALGGGERDLTQGHYERVLNLAQENVSGRKIELPGRFAVLRDYEKLIFVRSTKKIIGSDAQVREPIRLKVPGRTRFEDYLIEAAVLDAENCNVEKFKGTKTNFIEWFDLDKVKLPLVVRFRQAGDKFVPLGLSEEKKVGKFLTATKVPVEKRGKLLVVADGEKIIWVWPIRISEQAKLTDTTRRILNLQITY